MTEAAGQFGEVGRLKTLLFRTEQEAIADIQEQLDAHHERIGSDAAMQESVSGILAGALKDAQVREHKKVAEAISPILVEGMKREIKNSRDEMVDALYPIMGRLVSAYVSSALSEVMERTNRKLESGLSGRFLYLRAKAALTGRPYSELVLADQRRFQIDELMLIRRGSGVLIDHLQLDLSDAMDGETKPHDSALVSGVVAAIHEFSQEAFSGRKSALRSVDMGDQTIYLRATSGLIFAVIGHGKARRKFENALDKELVTLLEEHSDDIDRLEGIDATAGPKILPLVADRLMSVQDADRQRRPVLLILLLGLALMGVIGWAGWSAYEAYQTSRLRTAVTEIIASKSAFDGLPMQIDISRDRSSVSLGGFAPSSEARQNLVRDIEQRIAPVDLSPRIRVLPTTERLEKRILQAEDRVKVVTQEITIADKQITSVTDGVSSIATLYAQLQRIERDGQNARETYAARAEELKQRIATLEADMREPRRRLAAWVKEHGVFFADGTAYRDPERAERTLNTLAELLNAADGRVRVVGYADIKGTAESNQSLAQDRADRVLADLIAAGLKPDRAIAVGRSVERRFTTSIGPESGNRRVEFELRLDEE